MKLYSLRITLHSGHRISAHIHARTDALAELDTAAILGAFHPRTPPRAFTLHCFDENAAGGYSRRQIAPPPAIAAPVELTLKG